MNTLQDSDIISNKESILSLKILEEIEQQPSITQRTLSTRLKIALGLANSLIKRLVRKGHIKLTTLPSNRVKYLLTPQGITEKTRLTYEYLQYSLSFYKNTKSRIQQVLNNLVKEGRKNIAFFGAGEVAEIAYILVQDMGFNFKGVFEYSHLTYRSANLEVKSIEDILLYADSYIVITAFENIEKRINALKSANIDDKKIILL